MLGFFKTKKSLMKEIDDLKKIVECYKKPLSLDLGITAGSWSALSESEQVDRIRKLDLILTMKKTGRWDYESNCANLDI